MTEITRAMKAYMKAAIEMDGVISTNWVQRDMQRRMREAGLIEKNELGYYVPTELGLAVCRQPQPTPSKQEKM